MTRLMPHPLPCDGPAEKKRSAAHSRPHTRKPTPSDDDDDDDATTMTIKPDKGPLHHIRTPIKGAESTSASNNADEHHHDEYDETTTKTKEYRRRQSHRNEYSGPWKHSMLL